MMKNVGRVKIAVWKGIALRKAYTAALPIF